MENALNAREFLSRFHLPQLIRISNLPNGGHSDKLAEMFDNKSPSDSRNKHSAKRVSGAIRDQKEKRCNWTYLEPEFVRANRAAEVSAEDTDEHADNEARLHSMSTWSMSLESTGNTGAEPKRLHQFKQHQFKTDIDECSTKTKSSKAGSDCCISSLESSRGPQKCTRHGANAIGASIRLHPPTSRPALSKLELEQPFLLYKAYKKVELCAYAIDRRNELIDKSGHPIYFPFNYPGELGFSSIRVRHRYRHKHRHKHKY